ncbi:hypothetical protein N510_002259 [Firmicutes bacterium ASF500]|jgi:transcriptional regulator with XRE-family HTH domain|nr:hypothetical protein N510_002259 [Firmicutes bacterium ASF500]
MLVSVMNMYLRLRDLREDHDLTQKELSEAINVTQRSYSYYERGDHMIPLEVLCRLAEYYHTSVDYLLGRTGNPKPYPPK